MSNSTTQSNCQHRFRVTAIATLADLPGVIHAASGDITQGERILEMADQGKWTKTLLAFSGPAKPKPPARNPPVVGKQTMARGDPPGKMAEYEAGSYTGPRYRTRCHALV